MTMTLINDLKGDAPINMGIRLLLKQANCGGGGGGHQSNHVEVWIPRQHPVPRC